MSRLWVLAAVAAFAYFALAPDPVTPGRPGVPTLAPSGGAISLDTVIAQRRSGEQVSGQGTVVKMLSDDNAGSRHQRFILRLDSGKTLLIAHNIDLAPRIDTLRVGDSVAFRGEYAWNPKGGVIHWTHHDPQGRHPGGWIRHNGQDYQ